MRLLVIGAGSTGGYFGGLLARAGRDVTFLVRPARAAKLRADGLQIRSPNGDFTVRPRLVTAEDVGGPYDCVLLTVKAFALESAIADMAPAVGAETAIVPVLNGMKHVDLLTARFGARALLGGVCKVATTLDAEGRILHLAPFHDLAYGEMDATSSARTAALDAFMQGAGFDARLTAAIAREMWEKWILLAALGGITCLMRGTVGEVAAAPGGVDFAHAFIEEVVSTVRAVGIAPSEGFLATARAALTKAGSPQTSSMYRDLHAGLPIEAEQIVGDLLARAGRAGIPTPLLATAYAHLSVYQARTARN